MCTAHNCRVHFRCVCLILVAIITLTVTGCQTASYRRYPQRLARPSDHSSQTFAAQSGHDPARTSSAFDGAEWAPLETGTDDVAAGEKNLFVVTESEAKDLFNSLRGKLRASDDGAIVEADLAFGDVSDEQLAAIEALPEIRELDLTGTQVHDDGLAVLPKLQKLQALKLKGTRISNDGMHTIAQIPTLVLLDASNTDVSDEGLSLASQWTSLRYLTLNNTTVSDAAIPYLKSIGTLKGLSLLNSNVTSDGVRILREALPGCLIVTKAENPAGPSASTVPFLQTPSPEEGAFAEFSATSGTQLDQLVHLARQQPQLAVHLASIYSAREQWPEAAQILSAAAAVDSTNLSIQMSLGAALARSGQSQAAKTHFTQAVGEAAANYNLGLIEYENNLRSCANRFRNAIAADPSFTDAQSRLQEVQLELAELKQQRMPGQRATYGTVPSQDAPLEVIPAPSVRSASFSNSGPRSLK